MPKPDDAPERKAFLAKRQPGGKKGEEVVVEQGLDPDRPDEPVQVRLASGDTLLLRPEEVAPEPPPAAAPRKRAAKK
jgi:hypothetical protein